MTTKAPDPSLHQGPLHVTVTEPDPTTLLVTVHGELDLATAGHFEAHLADALASGRTRIVVDLTGVTFLGVAGITGLLRARNRAGRSRTALRVVAAHRAVLRPMDILGLASELPVHPSLASALNPLPRPRY